jgi:large subunit ribosomal protein L9
MKIVLLKNVDKIGKVGETKEVAEGYGRNFLIPRGLARLATPGVIAKIEAQKRAATERTANKEKKIKRMAKDIAGIEIKIAAKVGEGGKLYGSIGTEEIAVELKKRGFEIAKNQVNLKRPIKDVGGHEVMIKLREGLEVKILLRVVEGK